MEPFVLPAKESDRPEPRHGLAPSLERKRLRYYAALLIGDELILVACFAITSLIYLPGAPQRHDMIAAVLLTPIYLTLALYNGTYSLKALTDWKGSAAKMIFALALAGAFFNFFAFFAKVNEHFSRVVFLGAVLAAMLVMGCLRYAIYRLSRKSLGPSPLNKLVILAGGPDVRLPFTYRIDAGQHGLIPDLTDPHALNRFAHYVRNMDEVVISCSRTNRRLWSEMLKTSGVHGEVIDEYAREIGALGVVHRPDAGIASLLVSSGRLGLRARATKRIFDLSLSGFAILLLSPLMLVVSALIKLEDGGPVLFRQRRMGRGNRFFEIYKFRSMRVESSDAHGSRSTARDDVRVTRIGALIRKTSIDELPQLFNVIKGDMSLVGPRPHALGSQAGSKLFWEIDPKYWRRHVLRPGITGLAQIRGYRGATETERDLSARLQADLEYLNGWTLWRDVQILLRTILVLTHDRAF